MVIKGDILVSESRHWERKDVGLGGDVDWSIHNSSCPNYVGVDSSIHALLTGGTELISPWWFRRMLGTSPSYLGITNLVYVYVHG